MSDTLADLCRDKLMKGIIEGFKHEYLYLMTPEDAKSVTQLHRYVQGVDGIGRSLDCMHYDWAKCPKAWQGMFKHGDQKYASLSSRQCVF